MPIETLFELKILIANNGLTDFISSWSVSVNLVTNLSFFVKLMQNAKCHIIVMSLTDIVIVVGLDQGSPGSRRS